MGLRPSASRSQAGPAAATRYPVITCTATIGNRSARLASGGCFGFIRRGPMCLCCRFRQSCLSGRRQFELVGGVWRGALGGAPTDGIEQPGGLRLRGCSTSRFQPPRRTEVVRSNQSAKGRRLSRSVRQPAPGPRRSRAWALSQRTPLLGVETKPRGVNQREASQAIEQARRYRRRLSASAK